MSELILNRIDDVTLELDFGLPGPRGPAGSGDVFSNTSVSVDSEIALFSGTTGKEIKRATHSGLLKSSAGIIAAATADSDYLSPSSYIDCGTFN